MNCPYCGKEMEKGSILSNGSSLLFSVRAHPFLKLAGKGDVPLARGLDAEVSAYHCPACRKIMIDYASLENA